MGADSSLSSRREREKKNIEGLRQGHFPHVRMTEGVGAQIAAFPEASIYLLGKKEKDEEEKQGALKRLSKILLGQVGAAEVCVLGARQALMFWDGGLFRCFCFLIFYL